MTISTIRNGRSRAGRLGAAFALLSLLGGMALSPVFADGDRGGDRGDHGDRGRHHEHWRQGYDRQDWRGRAVYEPYPVYTPAPVYYAPQPPTGISLFFPIQIR